jgi:uncharacterized protein (DUF1697 family)
MPNWIGLFRAMNVSGHNVLKMEELRRAFESHGFASVRTYLQSGNVLFRDGERSAPRLCARIDALLRDRFKMDSPVVLRTSEQLNQAIEGNPFFKEERIDPSRLYVAFLSGPGAETGLSRLDALAAPTERWSRVGREVHLYYGGGYARTRLTNTAIEKALGVQATTRNWNTVNQLRALSRAD